MNSEPTNFSTNICHGTLWTNKKFVFFFNCSDDEKFMEKIIVTNPSDEFVSILEKNHITNMKEMYHEKAFA